mgnify:CR=1 FL=1
MGLDEAQCMALIHAAAFLDVAAGEGVGVQINKTDGTTVSAFADDVVTALAIAFGLELADSRFAFRDAVKKFIGERP